MEFDILDYSDEKIKGLTNVQMQLLRTAQKRKNELKYKLEQDLELFKKLVLTDDLKDSSLVYQKRAELEAEYNRELDIVVEQLEYSLLLNEPFPDQGGDQTVGYIVDYTLPYTERYKIVRDYYLAIEDPAVRMALYGVDDVAKRYLDSYYSTLYNVLYAYSQ